MIELKQNGRVDARQLHTKLEIKTRFNGWIEDVIDRIGLREGKGFYRIQGKTSSVGGAPRKEFEFTLESAQEACLVTKSKYSKELRKYLIDLGDEVENGLRPTHSEILFLMDLVKLFAYHEYRERARSLHREAYVHNLSGGKQTSGWMYGRFEKWRADALGLGKEDLETKIKEYCIANYARVPKRITQAEALIIIDKYELIKNAVWDLLMSKNKSEQYIRNICALAKELAERLEPEFKRWNQQTLFGGKEKTVEFRVLQAIQ